MASRCPIIARERAEHKAPKSGNFHAVEPGVTYRSGQLSGQQFASHIREQVIRTIINFRGNNGGQAWYDEMKASRAADVQHIDYPISAGAELSGEQVNQLVKLLRDAPRPILILVKAEQTEAA